MAYSTSSNTPPTIVASAILPALASYSTCGVLSDFGLGSHRIPVSGIVVSAVAVPTAAALGVSAGCAPALEASTGRPSPTTR